MGAATGLFDKQNTRPDDPPRRVDVERKLTAILCADVYAYSRLMGQDEEATFRALSSHRKLIDSLAERRSDVRKTAIETLNRERRSLLRGEEGGHDRKTLWW